MGRPDRSGEAADDPEWTRELWSTVRCAGVLLALLLLVDWGSGRITPWRAALWCVLAGLLFVVLYPARVSAGGNWLASRRLVREHRVRTDLLVSVRCLDGISERILLRDALGGRVEIDPEVLVRNPQLWLRLDEGARKAAADGSLLCGATALRCVAQRVHRETARAVFQASGLE
ncbi:MULTISPECIES: hypothetical protein [unclassified Streptomyces]|uniref:hypothetical protein n=1 Tax=unclassified Streptomyces TaxID=2593676 RepID=UPI002366E457|nr:MULTISPECIES: hypothetical protein [unclassified Streptomyces]MDF3142812.1 hypothetical protein [Streptomyces sp. T21Q-yed]WDF42336.1 hypothetical protein PBV52_38850 [Streptomyces sp. T12]